jgi:hypothetical protein
MYLPNLQNTCLCARRHVLFPLYYLTLTPLSSWVSFSLFIGEKTEA